MNFSLTRGLRFPDKGCSLFCLHFGTTPASVVTAGRVDERSTPTDEIAVVDGGSTVTYSRSVFSLSSRVFSPRLVVVVGSWRLRQIFCISGLYCSSKSSGIDTDQGLCAPFTFVTLETLGILEIGEWILVFGILCSRECFKQPLPLKVSVQMIKTTSNNLLLEAYSRVLIQGGPITQYYSYNI